MADKLPPRRESQSVTPELKSDSGPTWLDVFGGSGTPGSAETMALRVRLAIAKLNCLTPREQEVAFHYLEHLDDKRVARTLGTSVHTVHNQLASILDKLDLESRHELIATIVYRSMQD